MSEEARKSCRTQGKYSDRSQYCEDKRSQKRFRDKGQKVSPVEKKFHMRESDGSKDSSTSLLSNESESPVRYHENSDHSFSELEDVRKPVEIETPGRHVLSATENGESIVLYNPCFIELEEADDLMDRLYNTTNWHSKNIVIRGVEYPQPRLVAWYGPFPYSYSGTTLEPAEMPDCILEIKKKVEQYLMTHGINVELNSVLLNLYRNNRDSVSWHSDDEISMGVCPTIASVSLGETRKFEMRRKLKHSENGESSHVKENEYFVHLCHGSLIIMDGCMQKDWQHRVPKEYHDRYERINLTFRTVYELENLSHIPDTGSKMLPVDNTTKKSEKIEINLDHENFPPLNSPQEHIQDFSSPLKIDEEFNRSHERRDTALSSHNKSLPKNDHEISGSEEYWDIEISSHEAPLKPDDKINQAEEQGSYPPSYNKNKSMLLNNLNDDKKNVKIDMQSKNLHAYSSSFSNNDMNAGIRKNRTFNMKENHSLNNMQENNSKVNDKKNVKIDTRNKSVHTYVSSVSSNNMNADIKNKNFTRKENHSIYTNSPVNSIQEDVCKVDDKKNLKIDIQSKNLHAYSSGFSNNNMNADIRKNKDFTMKEKDNVYTDCRINNMQENICKGDDKKNIKSDMQSKNLHACDSHFSSKNNMNADTGKNKIFSMNENHVFTNSSLKNMQENVSTVKNEPVSSVDSSWTPNVEAKEFVPINTYSAPHKNPALGLFELEDLLNYNIYVMPYESLITHSYALRNKILQKIHEFKSFHEELKILCELTDGSQTKKNQIIITARMVDIVAKGLKEHRTSPNIRKSFGNSRQPNHGNHYHYTERKYQDHFRGSYHRH